VAAGRRVYPQLAHLNTSTRNRAANFKVRTGGYIARVRDDGFAKAFNHNALQFART